MKNLVLSALLVLPILVGCSTITPTQLQTSAAVMQATVPVAVSYAVSQDTNTIPYFRASADAIDLVAKGTNDSPALLIADLNKIPAVATSPYAKPAVLAGVGIYTAFYGQTVAGDTNTIILLEDLAADIRIGLGSDSAKKLKRKK